MFLDALQENDLAKLFYMFQDAIHQDPLEELICRFKEALQCNKFALMTCVANVAANTLTCLRNSPCLQLCCMT